MALPTDRRLSKCGWKSRTQYNLAPPRRGQRILYAQESQAALLWFNHRPSNLGWRPFSAPFVDFEGAVPPEKLPALVVSGPLPQPLFPLTFSLGGGGGGGSQSPTQPSAKATPPRTRALASTTIFGNTLVIQFPPRFYCNEIKIARSIRTAGERDAVVRFKCRLLS